LQESTEHPYVYETDKIREQYEKLTKSFDDKTRFFYAAKALTNINILKYIQKLGANIDCVSINEVNLGLKAGFTPEKILFTPNCVDITEIEEAMKLGVHINIDNISILEQFGINMVIHILYLSESIHIFLPEVITKSPDISIANLVFLFIS
jgi:diaminopimelate decarboxylase